MEREIIAATVAGLPDSRLGEIQQDHEIWEETDGGAHFKVTRHILPGSNGREMIGVSISGDPHERRRIIQEFTEVFGPPAVQDDASDQAGHIDIVAWLLE